MSAIADLSERINASLVPELPGPGVYPGVSFPEYHGWNAASNSRLSILREQTPAHLKAELDAPTDTIALRMGRAIHCAVLEPDSFPSRYVRAERCSATKKGDGKRCTNTGIFRVSGGWVCGVHGSEGLSLEGITVIPADDYERCLKARDAVWANPSARALLSGDGQAELSLRWQDEETGLPLKARLDRLSPRIAGGAVVDLKKTKNASRSAFERVVWTYGYHVQGGLYTDGSEANNLDAEHFAIIAQEDFPPYATAVYRINEAALDAGREQVRPLIRLYAECVEKNEWPAYPTEVRDLALPDYAWSSIDRAREETI